MASYSTQLKTWGATGSVYPDGYSYLKGEQPVDDWDNFTLYHLIKDVQHLVTVTNDRIETDKGATADKPGSPESSHLWSDESTGDLEYYDSVGAAWHRLLKADGDTMSGALNMGGYQIGDVGKIDFPSDGGARILADMGVSATPAQGTEESFSIKVDGQTLLQAYAEADGAGSIQNGGFKLFSGGSSAIEAIGSGPISFNKDIQLNGNTIRDILTIENSGTQLTIDIPDTTDPALNLRSGGSTMLAVNGISKTFDFLGVDLLIGGQTFLKGVPVSGETTLTSGVAVVDTGISTTDATFMLALGVDDPNADVKVSGRLFWDDSAGTYKIEIVENGTSVGNPTVNYDVLRIR